MSIEALRWVRPLRLQPATKLLAWALADFADPEGLSWPSVAALCEATCLHRRSVQRELRALVECGALVIVSGGGRGRTTRYRLQVGAAIRETVAVRRGCAPATAAESRPFRPKTRTMLLPIAGGRAGAPATAAESRPFRPQTVAHGHGLAVERVADGRGCAPERVAACRPEPPGYTSEVGTPVEGARVRRAERGSRLAPEWAPSDEDAAYAIRLGLNPIEVLEDFRAHWLSKAGPDARKVSWSLTWQRWCRRVPEFQRGAAAPGGGKPGRSYFAIRRAGGG
jgi:hypothetical protein